MLIEEMPAPKDKLAIYVHALEYLKHIGYQQMVWIILLCQMIAFLLP